MMALGDQDKLPSARPVRVLVTGANGFIGSAVVTALQRAGLQTRCVVRDPARFQRRFPNAEACALDLTDAHAHEIICWTPLLAGVDAVVNVAGVLQPRWTSDAWDVHHRAPDALYAACEKTGTRRIVHVSAVGITDTETAYAASKRAGEACLTARNLDWTVLRPVVVLGDDSYGGTSLVRAMAAFPFAIPMIGDGATPLNVIHKDDLAEGIVSLVTNGGGVREVLEPTAAGRLTLVELVAAYRNWLGFPPRPVLRLPMPVAKCVARVGDVMRMPPVTSTALAQLGGRLTGDGAGFRQATGVVPFRHASRLAAMTRFPERLPSVVSPPPRLDHRRARGLVAPVPRGFRCGVRPSAVRGGGSGSANRSAWQRGPGSESAAALGGLQWLEVVSLREAGRFASRREASVEEADWRLFQKFGVGALAAPAVVLMLAQQPGEPGVVGVAIESLLRHSVPMQFLGR